MMKLYQITKILPICLTNFFASIVLGLNLATDESLIENVDHIDDPALKAIKI